MLPLDDYYFPLAGEGGSTPNGTIEITTNGVHDVTEYAEANVSVFVNGNPLQERVDSNNSCAYLCYEPNTIASYVESVDYLKGLDTSKVTDMSHMFKNMRRIESIPPLDVSNVENADYMFSFCMSLKGESLSWFKPTKLKSIQYFFQNCYDLGAAPLFDTSKVTDMTGMFYSVGGVFCPEVIIPLYDTSNVTKMSEMFRGATVEVVPLFDTSKVTHMNSMFEKVKKLRTIPQFDMSNVKHAYYFCSECEDLVTIPALDTSKIGSISSLFTNCYNLETIEGLDMNSAYSISDIVKNCAKLVNLTVKNVRATLQIGSGTSYGHLLTLESLLNTCKECIDVNADRKLTIGSANLEKLSNVYVKPITITDEMKAEDPNIEAKVPFEVVDSTVEGAQIITEYMQGKGWTLA